MSVTFGHETHYNNDVFDQIDIKIDIDLSLHVRLTSEKLNSAQGKRTTVKVLFLLELQS